MSTLVLKLIAYLTMTLDHIGYFSGDILLRAIGRIALPIYCFLIAQGFRHTRSPLKYALRLLAFALVAEIPFNYFVTGNLLYADGQNIMWTLLLGLICLIAGRFYRQKSQRFAPLFSVLTVFLACLVAIALRSDYTYFGVMLIVIFGAFDMQTRKGKAYAAIGFFALCAWRFVSFYLYAGLGQTGFDLSVIPLLSGFFVTKLTTWEFVKLHALCALPFLLSYNGQKGSLGAKSLDKATSVLFYLYYPLHLVMIALLMR